MFSQDTGLYFYSAWLQADAAIFALIFIFIVYKLQSIENTIHSITAMIHNDRNRSVNISFLDIMKDPDARARSIENTPNESWRNLLESLGKASDDKSKIYALIKPTFWILPIVLFLTSILLLLSNVLHNNDSLAEFVGFGVLLAFQLYLIFKMTKIIRNLMFD